MGTLYLASTSLSRTRQATLSNQPMPLLPVLHRAIRKLHLDTCEQLGVEASVRAEVERLLNELAQLLVGISIMQVSKAVVGLGFKERDAPDGREQRDARVQGRCLTWPVGKGMRQMAGSITIMQASKGAGRHSL